MSLWTVTGGALRELTAEEREASASRPKQDPKRPSAPLRPVAGREHDAARASEALAVLCSLARGDERMRKEIVRALIDARVVEVVREDGGR